MSSATPSIPATAATLASNANERTRQAASRPIKPTGSAWLTTARMLVNASNVLRRLKSRPAKKTTNAVPGTNASRVLRTPTPIGALLTLLNAISSTTVPAALPTSSASKRKKRQLTTVHAFVQTCSLQKSALNARLRPPGALAQRPRRRHLW